MDNRNILADVVVIAMGPWCTQAKRFFPKCRNFPTITGKKAHSIIVEADVSPDALFLSYIDEGGQEEDPELYPR